MADDGGEVQVKLSQEGGDEVIAKLKEMIAKLSDLGEAAKSASDEGAKTGEAVKGIASAANITALATGATAVMEFGAKVYETSQKVYEFAASFIEAASEEEQLTIQMAALETKLMDFNEGLERSKENLLALKDTKVLGDEEHLAGVFRKLTLMVGGTDESLVQLTKKMSLLAQESGVTADQLLRVVQMAERTGTLPMRGQMAMASLAFKNAGVSGADIQEAAAAVARGESDALQNLLDKVKISDDAVKAMEGSWKNLGDQWTRSKGEIVDIIGGGFEPLKEVVQSLIALLKSNAVRDAVKSFADAVRDGIADSIQLVKNLSEGIDHLSRSWGIAKRYWSTDPKDSFAAVQEASKEESDKWAEYQRQKSWRDKIRDAGGVTSAAPGGEFDSVGDHKAIVDLDKQAKAAKEALDQLYKKLDEKVAMAGLDSVDAKVAQINSQTEQEIDQLDKAAEKARLSGVNVDYKKLQAEKVALTKAAEAEIDGIYQEAADKREATEQKAAQRREQIEVQYDQTIRSLMKGLSDDVIASIDEQTESAVRGAEDRAQKMKNTLEREHDDRVKYAEDNIREYDAYKAEVDSADRDYAEKSKGIETALQEFIDATRRKAAQKKKEILDLEHGDWTAYYNDLMKQAADAHQNLFIAAQENSRKVAGEMAKAAQDGAAGWEAGLAQIKAATTSFGQDVASTMGSVWKSLGSAFETGFYDVLSGKFDSLKDVLKSLWDSILKDFSKLLAQMLERWILTGDAMGNGHSSGGFGSLLSLLGGKDSAGSQAVTTPGGTSAIGPYEQGYTQYGDYIGGGTSGSGGAPGAARSGGGISGGGAADYGALAAYGIGLYGGISSIFKPHETSTPTYNGQSLGQTADFGGPGGGAALTGAVTVALAAATATLATAAATGVAITAAAAATVPVIGWIAAAVLLIVAVFMTIFSGKQEGHINIQIADAFEKSGARSVIGNVVDGIISSTANFVGALALKAGGPDGVQKYVLAYQTAFKEAYGNAKFDLAAGSPEDLQKDVETFFKTTLPTMAMRAAFGQVGYDPNGNRDNPGGMAGMDWNIGNASVMDAQGNFVKKQLYDPNAPIPMMLTGLGFSADAITAIAQKLATGVDIEQFKKDLMDLVGAVASLGELSKQMGRTTQEWFDFIHDATKKQGTAGEFTASIDNLKGSGVLLDSMTGADQVNAAKQLITDSGTVLNNMGQAIASILNMIDTIKQTTADTIKSYENKLLTPAQRETGARADYLTDMFAITAAANPKEVQAAWQQVMKDLSAVLDAIVTRITAIKSLQQGYADFRTAMDTAAGPQFGTDPQGWLSKNQRDIDAVTATLKTAVGDDAVTAAQKLLDLTKERYQNEVAQLAKINGIIQSITEQGKTTSDNLKMQGMGSVVNGKWVPDTHAQGDYLKGQYDDLMKQLGTAATPEEVQKIYGKLQGIISQLASQPQDPEHYAESRTILSGMNDAATKAATDLLKKWGKDLDTDLAGTGDKLKAGETALATALDAANKDFTKYLGLMNDASLKATAALTDFADGLSNAMRDLQKSIDHWTWSLTHTADEKDPNWDYTKNAPKDASSGAPGGGGTDVWEDDPSDDDFQICTAGPHKGNRRRKPGTRPGPDRNPNAGGPGDGTAADLDAFKKKLAATATTTVNLTIQSGTAEEIAAAAADAVYDQTVEQIKANNVALVRAIRENPVIVAAGTS